MATTLRERYGQARLTLILTRTDRRAEIGVDDVERTVGLEVQHSFPSDYRLALQAMNKGRPIALDPQTELAGAFISVRADAVGRRPRRNARKKNRGPRARVCSADSLRGRREVQK